jgi:hypothetical protein
MFDESSNILLILDDEHAGSGHVEATVPGTRFAVVSVLLNVG